ncbi:MAG TPA: hypothetical protein VK983_04005 [Candidatus Limnocylindrales bacterium]|nr:hypothetical protein [Candidatus Limnocylindrales bacterium]
MKVDWQLSLKDVIGLLVGAPFDWYVCGGWALDEFICHTTRSHADVDIAVLRKDVKAIFSYLNQYELQVVSGPDELIANASPPDLKSPRHAIWVKNKSNGNWLFELLLNDSTDTNWLYRRNYNCTLPLDRLGIQRNGYKLLAPEVVLLYKSKNPRPVDQKDFSNILPSLPQSSRQWLKKALQLTTPGHPWIAQL